ncbi:MAG: TIGR02300 family protein [Alphaproteobacteria bacterium]
MAKPEWGTKRVCRSCGALFYDMCREPATCPKCGSVYEPEATSRVKRAAPPEPAPAVVAAVPVVVAPAVANGAEESDVVAEGKRDDGEDLGDIETDEDDEGGDIIEDPSELGEDEDDMAEVIDGSLEEDDER